MLLEKYDYQMNDDLSIFTFNSSGPKGTIHKIVRYQFVNWNINNMQVMNIGFGDWHELLKDIDDLAISNNQDRNRILATVAATVVDYLEKYPDRAVYAIGSTPVKTRLYQMGINAHLTQIQNDFSIYGKLNNRWREFIPGINYCAFLILKNYI